MKLAAEGMAIVKLPHRRQFLQLAAGAAALPAVPHVARAQSYPSRPVTLVVPIAAGGGLDTTARILAEKLQDNLQQPFVVENRPGAGSTVGTNLVAKAKPDGYTLLLMEVSAVWAKWLASIHIVHSRPRGEPEQSVAIASLTFAILFVAVPPP